MERMNERNGVRRGAVCLAASMMLVAGCKSKPSDAALAATIQAKLASDTALVGQSVQPSVQQGVVTLTGLVANDALRTVAARDAAEVPGVVRVIDSIQQATGGPTTGGNTAGLGDGQGQGIGSTIPIGSIGNNVTGNSGAAPGNAAGQGSGGTSGGSGAAKPKTSAPGGQPQETASGTTPAPIVRAAPTPVAPPPPPPPAPPAFRTVTVGSGSVIPVRVTQTLDSGSTQVGTTFSGVVTSDVMVDGVVVIAAGSSVAGTVDEVKDAAHFKGSSSLSVSLSSVTRHGEHVAVNTEPYTVVGKGRGTNTAEKVGGGAVAGALIGGLLGRGKGAAIGAVAGGGAGAGVQAATRGQQVQIASESVVRFHLSTPVSVKVRVDGDEPRGNTDPALQHHTP